MTDPLWVALLMLLAMTAPIAAYGLCLKHELDKMERAGLEAATSRKGQI